MIAKSGMMNFAESGIDEAPLQSHYLVPLHDLCCLRSFKERRLQVCANLIGPGASRWKGGGASRKVLREPHCREARSLEPLDISLSIPILPPIFREVHNSTRNYRLSRIPSGIAILHYEAKWSLRPISLKNAIRWSDASTFSCDVNSPINRITSIQFVPLEKRRAKTTCAYQPNEGRGYGACFTGSYKSAFIGLSLLILGALCMGICIKLACECDQCRVKCYAAIFTFIIGFIASSHGLFFAFSGDWPELASSNCLTENVSVLPVVVPELKLGDVERQIFLADLVECSDHPALNQRPETFNRIGMHRADNILAARMVDCGVRKFFVAGVCSRPIDR